MTVINSNSFSPANPGVNAPFAMGFFSYLALTLVFGSVIIYRRQKLVVSSSSSSHVMKCLIKLIFFVVVMNVLSGL
ncbi:unnamed protein product [Lactuca virosa]|uniref:Uncharacterized protein n=1 Tax=Lactuca virosa TaxID=75947 RepID=A0AAU9NA81_9ASTR|nr:unnamed protein product [Lactuca virosa]